jgi:hypothetical protein
MDLKKEQQKRRIVLAISNRFKSNKCGKMGDKRERSTVFK